MYNQTLADVQSTVTVGLAVVYNARAAHAFRYSNSMHLEQELIAGTVSSPMVRTLSAVKDLIYQIQFCIT